MKYCLYIILLCILIGCKQQGKENLPVEIKPDPECSCPPTIYLQPLGSFTQTEALKLKRQLCKNAKGWFANDIIEILPEKELDSSTLNTTKTRYSASKILHTFDKADHHNVYIGLLHEDISILKNGNDWGILGLSYKDKNVSVVSTFRVKNKERDLWKVVMHEFIHAYCGYGHCPKDNENCIMQDAKGHPKLKNKKDLCDYCKKHL